MSKLTSLYVDEVNFDLICSFGEGKFTQGVRNICEALMADEALKSDLIEAIQATKTKKMEHIVDLMFEKIGGKK